MKSYRITIIAALFISFILCAGVSGKNEQEDLERKIQYVIYRTRYVGDESDAEMITSIAQKDKVPMSEIESILIKYLSGKGKPVEDYFDQKSLKLAGVELLGDIKSKKALPLLKKIMLETNDKGIQNSAIYSIIKILNNPVPFVEEIITSKKNSRYDRFIIYEDLSDKYDNSDKETQKIIMNYLKEKLSSEVLDNVGSLDVLIAKRDLKYRHSEKRKTVLKKLSKIKIKRWQEYSAKELKKLSTSIQEIRDILLRRRHIGEPSHLDLLMDYSKQNKISKQVIRDNLIELFNEELGKKGSVPQMIVKVSVEVLPHFKGKEVTDLMENILKNSNDPILRRDAIRGIIEILNDPLPFAEETMASKKISDYDRFIIYRKLMDKYDTSDKKKQKIIMNYLKEKLSSEVLDNVGSLDVLIAKRDLEYRNSKKRKTVLKKLSKIKIKRWQEYSAKELKKLSTSLQDIRDILLRRRHIGEPSHLDLLMDYSKQNKISKQVIRDNLIELVNEGLGKKGIVQETIVCRSIGILPHFKGKEVTDLMENILKNSNDPILRRYAICGMVNLENHNLLAFIKSILEEKNKFNDDNRYALIETLIERLERKKSTLSSNNVSNILTYLKKYIYRENYMGNVILLDNYLKRDNAYRNSPKRKHFFEKNKTTKVKLWKEYIDKELSKLKKK